MKGNQLNCNLAYPSELSARSNCPLAPSIRLLSSTCYQHLQVAASRISSGKSVRSIFRCCCCCFDRINSSAAIESETSGQQSLSSSSCDMKLPLELAATSNREEEEEEAQARANSASISHLASIVIHSCWLYPSQSSQHWQVQQFACSG